DLSPSRGSYRRQKVQFLWAVRAEAEILWALPAEGKEREGFGERLRVWVTGGAGGGGLGGGTAEDGRFAATRGGRGANGDDEADEGIELEEQKGLLLLSSGGGSSGESGQVVADGVAVSVGRPNLAQLVDQVFSRGSSFEKVAIVVCGPRGLSQA
ncbi:hypothetical protein B0A55_13621, partial [Friedmanniomyces simplex]